MNESRPLISVIMPAYNAERFIEAAINSVRAQTVTDWELIVLDDCSGDGTRSVAERLAAEDSRIRLVCRAQNSGGAAVVRNQGLDLCSGDYVAFLDSDDIWLPEKLEKQLRKMNDADAQVCYTSYQVIGADGAPAKNDYLVPESTDFEKLLRENVIGCSTVVLRRSIAEAYRFRTDFYHEDYLLWLQLLKDGFRAVGCAEPLVKWRFVENSRSFNKGNSAKNRWRIYREYLKLPLLTAIRAFCAYAAAGLKKYSSRAGKQ